MTTTTTPTGPTMFSTGGDTYAAAAAAAADDDDVDADDDVYGGDEYDFGDEDVDDDLGSADEPPPLKLMDRSELAARGANTTAFRGVSASGYGRWEARLKHNGKNTNMGTFDNAEDDARAWDRMMLWCHLHGVGFYRGNDDHGDGLGRLHNMDSTRAALNFAYKEYAGESDKLRCVETMEAMVQKLRREGMAQPGCAYTHGFKQDTSTFNGVSFVASGRWLARVRLNGIQTRIGSFDGEEDAACACDLMMLWCDLHGVVHKQSGGRRVHTSGRGLHSSTFRLIVSVFSGIGSAIWGYLGGVYEPRRRCDGGLGDV